jgi:Tfp pilus assembly protein FimV
VVATLVVLGAMLLVTLAWLAGASRAQAAHAGGSPAHPYQGLRAMVVRPGETLWSIAQQTQPGADPRAVVQEIIDLNALSGSTVAAGERLWVPKR